MRQAYPKIKNFLHIGSVVINKWPREIYTSENFAINRILQ